MGGVSIFSFIRFGYFVDADRRKRDVSSSRLQFEPSLLTSTLTLGRRQLTLPWILEVDTRSSTQTFGSGFQNFRVLFYPGNPFVLPFYLRTKADNFSIGFLVTGRSPIRGKRKNRSKFFNVQKKCRVEFRLSLVEKLPSGVRCLRFWPIFSDMGLGVIVGS